MSHTVDTTERKKKKENIWNILCKSNDHHLPYSLSDGQQLLPADQVRLVDKDDVSQTHLPEGLVQRTIRLHLIQLLTVTKHVIKKIARFPRVQHTCTYLHTVFTIKNSHNACKSESLK